MYVCIYVRYVMNVCVYICTLCYECMCVYMYGIYVWKFVIERLRARIAAGAAGEFSSAELTLCADSYSVFIPPPC